MTQSPDSSSDEEFIDAVLGICATYGTTVLGTKDQEHFIAGFKHSKTYAEARAALEAHIATVELEARLNTLDRLEANRARELKEFDGVKLAVITVSALNNERRRLEQLEDQKGKRTK